MAQGHSAIMDIALAGIALSAAFCFALGLVLTQYGLRFIAPSAGACVSVPTSALLFALAAPWTIAFSQWSLASFTVFAIVGVFFPALVTFLNFEANKQIGPSLTGALGNLSPAFAVAFAAAALGETPNAPQVMAIAAVCIGVALLFLKPGTRAAHITTWMLALPLAAALIRGLVQPAIKYALIAWPDPFAAVTTGYLVSACVMAIYARISGLNRKDFNTPGVIWFMAIAVANGGAVFLLYAALARGPVTIVTPIVACYPVLVLMMNKVLREDRNVSARTITGVSITFAGIAMLLFYQ